MEDAHSHTADSETEATHSITASRVLDFQANTSNFNPIGGIKFAPLLSLPETIEFARSQNADTAAAELDGPVRCAIMFADNIEDERLLSVDEVAAIHLYTQESPFYSILNRGLRERDRSKIKAFLPFLRLMMSGLHKIPMVAQTVYRGVRKDLASSFKKGKSMVWWSFSSTTGADLHYITSGGMPSVINCFDPSCFVSRSLMLGSIEVLQNPQFLGNSGTRTMFAITALSTIDVRRYSAFQSEEDERILMPGTCLVVEGSYRIL